MKKILVPIDGSECAVRALRQAIRLGDDGTQLELHLLNVQPPLVSGHARMFLSREQLHGYYEDQSKEAMASALAVVGESGVPYVSAMQVGPAAVTIAEYASNEGCDNIVMGTRGLGSVAGMLLGSVATKVIHLAKVPVMLVK